VGSLVISLDDDPTIPDEAILWRRVPSIHWVMDSRTLTRRPSSAAFEDHPDGSPMSAALAAEMTGPEELLQGLPTFGIVAFTAGFARRECQQSVVRDPAPDKPWHVHVVGRKTDGVRKRFCRNSVTIKVPSPPYPP
jgi:hypothetical protein